MSSEICIVCSDQQHPKEQKVKCFGPCDSFYHLSCGGLKKGDFNALMGCDNLLWFCNNCLELVKSELEMKATVNKIKMLTESLKTTIDPLDRVVKMASDAKLQEKKAMETPSSLRSDARQTARKRQRTDGSNETPVISGSAKLTFGTKDGSSTLQPGTVYRDIYISRLSPETTVDDVINYIKNSKEEFKELEIRCKLLVPNGKNAQDLDFISFKVSVQDKDFQSVVDPSIWPNYVLVREFTAKQNNRQSKYKNFILRPKNMEME